MKCEKCGKKLEFKEVVIVFDHIVCFEHFQELEKMHRELENEYRNNCKKKTDEYLKTDKGPSDETEEEQLFFEAQ